MTGEPGSFDDDTRRRSKDSKYKLAWWEDDTKCCTAYGDKYWIDTSSALLHFEGTQGEILIPTRMMKFVVK
jgi:hypothetical protein